MQSPCPSASSQVTRTTLPQDLVGIGHPAWGPTSQLSTIEF